MVAVTIANNKTLTRCSNLYSSEAALVSVETLLLPPERVAESVVDIFQHSADTAAADPGPAHPAQAALGLAAGGLTLVTATFIHAGLVLQCSPPSSSPSSAWPPSRARGHGARVRTARSSEPRGRGAVRPLLLATWFT